MAQRRRQRFVVCSPVQLPFLVTDAIYEIRGTVHTLSLPPEDFWLETALTAQEPLTVIKKVNVSTPKSLSRNRAKVRGHAFMKNPA